MDFLIIPLGMESGSTSATLNSELLFADSPLPPRTRLDKARSILKFRLKRDALFAGIFGEPGWDMMLTAYVADTLGERSPVTSICAGSNGPPTTAIRWLKVLEKVGLMERVPDAKDKRRVFVQLSAEGRRIMDEVLDSAL